MHTYRKPALYRRATPYDIGWGKVVYLVCDESSRIIKLHEYSIEKLTKSQVKMQVGFNAFQHDEEVRRVNENRINQMKKIAHEYYVATD